MFGERSNFVNLDKYIFSTCVNLLKGKPCEIRESRATILTRLVGSSACNVVNQRSVL